MQSHPPEKIRKLKEKQQNQKSTNLLNILKPQDKPKIQKADLAIQIFTKLSDSNSRNNNSGSGTAAASSYFDSPNSSSTNNSNSSGGSTPLGRPPVNGMMMLDESSSPVQFNNFQMPGSKNEKTEKHVDFDEQTAQANLIFRQITAHWIHTVGHNLCEKYYKKPKTTLSARKLVCRALFYMHSFFDEFGFEDHNLFCLAVACIFLASKMDELIFPIRMIIFAMYRHCYPDKCRPVYSDAEKTQEQPPLFLRFYTKDKNGEISDTPLSDHKIATYTYWQIGLENIKGKASDVEKYTNYCNQVNIYEYQILFATGFDNESYNSKCTMSCINSFQNIKTKVKWGNNNTTKLIQDIPQNIIEMSQFLAMQYYMLSPLCTKYSTASIALSCLWLATQWSDKVLPIKKVMSQSHTENGNGKVEVQKLQWWEYSFKNYLDEVDQRKKDSDKCKDKSREVAQHHARKFKKNYARDSSYVELPEKAKSHIENFKRDRDQKADAYDEKRMEIPLARELMRVKL